MTRAKHPIQPLERDKQGVVRFKSNAIVRHLLDHGGIDLNALARKVFPKEDWEQFHQLIGYSHSGIPNVSEEIWQAAETMFKTGASELEARNVYLREQLDAIKAGLRAPVAQLFGIDPDNLEGST